MKNKNKKMIIVVACLLVVVGVSFAYFVSSILVGGNGASIEATTATIQNSELKVEGSLEFNDLDIYPGHTNVSSIKITATGDNELIPYNVIWSGENTLNTSLNYTVYKTSNEVDVNVTCEKTKGVVDGAMMYYEECSINNIDSLGTPIANGTINKNETKVVLASDEFITSTANGTIMYYYVVLEYPNLEEEQNSDIGGSFNGKVSVEKSDATPDINIVAAYIEQEDGTYKEVSDIPQEGYTINAEKSVCSNGATPAGETPNITINNLTKSGTSCYLYFDKLVPVKDTILANYSTVLTRSNFSTTVTETTTGTIYKSADSSQYDNDGEVYYFAGNPTDNWAKFAGFYWRIIRINGDGTIRLIYQGTSANATGSETQIGKRTFSINGSAYNNNAYVGYMYTIGQVHGLVTDNGVKSILDSWYQSNLSSYASKIDGNVGFCGDRSPSTSSSYSNGSGGTGTTTTYYGGYIRLITNKSPSFKCIDENNDDSDLYTISGSSDGNKALDYPIGLIIVDEVAFAGGVSGAINTSYYLYTNSDYWTMSPYFYSSNSYVFAVFSSGALGNSDVNWAGPGVRPVINLKADIKLEGSGTSTDPYVVVE